MVSILLSGITFTIVNPLAQSRWHSANVSPWDVARLLKWQTVLISLIVLFGLCQQTAMCGNIEYAVLFGGLAICELVIAPRS